MSNKMFNVYFNVPANAIVKCVLLTTCREKYGKHATNGNALAVYTLQQLRKSEEDYDAAHMEECVQHVQADKLEVVKRTMYTDGGLFKRNVYKHIKTGELFITEEEYNLAHDCTVQKHSNFVTLVSVLKS